MSNRSRKRKVKEAKIDDNANVNPPSTKKQRLNAKNNKQKKKEKQNLSEEDELFSKFEKIPELSKFVLGVKNNPDAIARFLDHPEYVQRVIENPESYVDSFQPDKKKYYFSGDMKEFAMYTTSMAITKQWFKENDPLKIINNMRSEFNIKCDEVNKYKISFIIDDITKNIYNLELTKEILNEIEYLSLNDDDHKINIIEIGAEKFTKELYSKVVDYEDSNEQWMEDNILNKTRFEIKNSIFTKYLNEKDYKNHHVLTSDDITDFGLLDNNNTKLTNNKISCGDIICIADLNCSDWIDHAISNIWYIVEPNNKFMTRIGITNKETAYVHSTHIVIPYFVTSRFIDPIKTYSTFIHIHKSWPSGEKDIQIELQVSNNCDIFNRSSKHTTFTKLEQNKVMSYYPWSTQSKLTTHKYQFSVDKMTFNKKSNFCTIYIDRNLDNHKGIFGYCNNKQIECINLSPLLEDSSYGYIVRYKGDKIQNNMTEKEVNKYLLKLDDTIDVYKVTKCLKKGIANYLIEIDKNKGLDTTLLKTKCEYCRTKIKCTIRDVLYQGDKGGDMYGVYEEGCVIEECDCCNYVTGMCTGNIGLVCGKRHHHCVHCPDMGICIGDYREGHCTKCDKHYYWGKAASFKCPNCTSEPDYSSDT